MFRSAEQPPSEESGGLRLTGRPCVSTAKARRRSSDTRNEELEMIHRATRRQTWFALLVTSMFILTVGASTAAAQSQPAGEQPAAAEEQQPAAAEEQQPAAAEEQPAAAEEQQPPAEEQQ